MALHEDKVQLDIIIGSDKSRKELTELSAEAAKLQNSIKSVGREHKKYNDSAKKLTANQDNLKKTTLATQQLEKELNDLSAEYKQVQLQVKKTAGSDANLIAKEKELAKALKVKNQELKYEVSVLKRLEREQIKLIATMKRTKAGNEEFIASSKRLKEVQASMKAIRQSFDLTALSMKELEQQSKSLKIALKTAIPGSEAYQKYEKRLNAVNQRLSELRVKSKGAANAQIGLKEKLQKANNFFNTYAAGIVTMVAGLSGLVFSIRKAIDGFNEFEQAEADLSALTGLTGDSLKYLSDSAKELSTSMTKDGIRIKSSATQIEEAFGIVGSQRPELLKSKEALKEVTQEALILAAASDGNLKSATIAVTSALNNFDLKANQTRRVINALAAGSKEGAADIPKLTKVFDKAATTANLMGMEVEDLVAISEAVAPKFNDMSMAGNSIDKVLMKLKDTGIGYKDGIFDINIALDELRVKIQNGEKVTKLFGSEHAKMVEVLLAEQSEINRYKKAITDTNVAIEQASIKTATNAVKLEQAKNKAQENANILGEQLTPALTFSTNAFSYLLKVLVVIIKNWDTFAKILIIGATAIATYTIATKGAIIAKNLYTKAVQLATVAQKIFSKAAKSNPWGLILTAVAAVVVAIIAFKDELKESSKAVRDFNKQLVKEKTELNNVFDALKKTGKGTEARKELIIKINKEYGKYLPNLLTENSSLKDIAEAQKLANSALAKNLALKSQEAAIVEATQKAIDVRAEITSDILQDATRDNKHLMKQASDELNEVIKLQMDLQKARDDYHKKTGYYDKLTGGKEANKLSEKVREFEFKYDIVNTEYYINDIIEAENEKNEKLKEIDAIFSAYTKKEKEQTYEQERQMLINQIKNNMISKEEYNMKLKALQLKYGKIKIKNEETNNNEIITTEKQKNKKIIEERKKLADELKAIREGYIASVDRMFEEELTDELDRLSAQRNNELNALDQRLKDTEEFRLMVQAINMKYDGEEKKVKADNRKTEIEAETNFQLAMLEIKEQSGEIDYETAFNEKMAIIQEQYDAELIAKQAFIEKQNQLTTDYKKKKEEKTLENFDDTEFKDNQSQLDELKELSDQKLISEEEFTAKKKELEEEHTQEKIDRADDYASDATDAINLLSTAFEIAQVAELKSLEESLAAKLSANDSYYEELLNNARLSGEQRTALLEEQALAEEQIKADIEEKKNKIERKYKKRQAHMQALQTAIDGAVAIVKDAAVLGPLALPTQIAHGIQTAASIALIEIKASQFAKGKYPVIGEDDGKLYNADYADKLGTGIIGSPVLVAEEPEMVVDNQTLYNPKKDKYGMSVMDHARSIMSIKHSKVPQFAEGKDIAVEAVGDSAKATNSDVLLNSIINEVSLLRKEIATFEKTKKVVVVYSDITEAGDRIAEITTDTRI